MTDEQHPEIERLLAEAFDAGARATVGDHATPPPPRFAQSARAPRRRRSWLAPVAAAAAVVAVAGGLIGVAGVGSGNDHVTGAGTPSVGPAPVQASDHAVAPATPVRIRTLNSDGVTYGVGMPVIAYFSRRITDAGPLTRATTVTVNGKRVDAQWYFENSAAGRGPIEGHLRPQSYWPAHAEVSVDIAARGLKAGGDMGYDNGLTLDFRTGARNVAVVDDATHRLALSTDGKPAGSYRVSLGATQTPTMSGTKVIMQKGGSVCMHGLGYDECNVQYAQRLSYGGEYLHAAPWNAKNIQRGVDSSNGCTNLTANDARTLYGKLEVGDVVQYPNAEGKPMTLGQGYGDWNVAWTTWRTGGLVPTH